MPNALRYTDIFGLELYNRMQKLSSFASVKKMGAGSSAATAHGLAINNFKV